MDLPYISDVLFHFVGHSAPQDDALNFETLRAVLDSGSISHFPHKPGFGETRYRLNLAESLAEGRLIDPGITCFADIPQQSLAAHVAKYGRFGIGLPKALLTKYGARPVTYVPMRYDDYLSPYGRSLLKDVEAIYRGFVRLYHEKVTSDSQGWERKHGAVPDTELDVLRALKSFIEKDVLAFVKPFNSELPSTHPDCFYMEREWRKFGGMPFTMDDISLICVAGGYKGSLEDRYPALRGRVVELMSSQ